MTPEGFCDKVFYTGVLDREGDGAVSFDFKITELPKEKHFNTIQEGGKNLQVAMYSVRYDFYGDIILQFICNIQ